MKRIVTMTMIAFVVALLMSLPALAATIDGIETSVNPLTNEVQVRGTIDSGTDRQVTLRIIDPLGNLEYIDQTMSGATGSFSFHYTLTNAMEGTYDVEVGGEGVTANVYEGFTYQYTLPIEFDVSAVFSVGGIQGAEQLVANQLLHADVIVTNVRDMDRSVLIVVGLFDEQDELVDFAYVPVTIAADGGTAQFEGGFKLPANVNGYHAKAFVMEGNTLANGTIVDNTEVVLPSYE